MSYIYRIYVCSYAMPSKYVFILSVTIHRRFCRRCHVVKVDSQADQRATFRFVRGIEDSDGFSSGKFVSSFPSSVPLHCRTYPRYWCPVWFTRISCRPRSSRDRGLFLSALISRLLSSLDAVCSFSFIVE